MSCRSGLGDEQRVRCAFEPVCPDILVAVASGEIERVHATGALGPVDGMERPSAESRRTGLLTKLGARDRAQLVMLAYESGVISPGATS